jgi:hypothetical protein
MAAPAPKRQAMAHHLPKLLQKLHYQVKLFSFPLCQGTGTWQQQPSTNVRCQVPVPMAGVADFSRKLVEITLFLFSVKKR